MQVDYDQIIKKLAGGASLGIMREYTPAQIDAMPFGAASRKHDEILAKSLLTRRAAAERIDCTLYRIDQGRNQMDWTEKDGKILLLAESVDAFAVSNADQLTRERDARKSRRGKKHAA